MVIAETRASQVVTAMGKSGSNDGSNQKDNNCAGSSGSSDLWEMK